MLWEDKEEQRMVDNILRLPVSKIEDYFMEYKAFYHNDDKAFSRYMRLKFKEKGISQRDAFKLARISERYGYKLISQEKRTSQRDVIIRLCLALHMDVMETQKALILGGFPYLCISFRRDVIILVAINNKYYSIDEMNGLLTKHNEAILYEGMNQEEN